MKHLKRSTGLIPAMLLTLTVVLAACGGSSTTSTLTPTTAPALSVAGDFVGQIPSVHAWVGLSSDGQHIIA